MPPEQPATDPGPSRQQRLHAERSARGLCPRCGERAPEIGLRLCDPCGGKRRAAERARRARARAEGKPYGGRDPEASRKAARAGDKRRRRARREAGLCTSCGSRPPADGGSVCEPCREARRAGDRRRHAERRAAGLCTRCARPAFGGSSRCGRCAALEAERTPPGRGRAASRKRYARRRARGLCVDCGVPSAGAARCPPCAYRSNRRARLRDAIPPWPPLITVTDLETGEELGTFETEAEAAACLVFAGLRPDQVEIRSDGPLMALVPGRW